MFSSFPWRAEDYLPYIFKSRKWNVSALKRKWKETVRGDDRVISVNRWRSHLCNQGGLTNAALICDGRPGIHSSLSALLIPPKSKPDVHLCTCSAAAGCTFQHHVKFIYVSSDHLTFGIIASTNVFHLNEDVENAALWTRGGHRSFIFPR